MRLKPVDFFNNYAEHHENIAEERLLQYELNHFISLLSKENAKILDIGCAAGRDAQYFAEYGFSVYGVDISDELIKRAIAKKIKNSRFETGDIHDFKPCGEFDGIWAMDIISYAEKAELINILKNFNKSLKQGGILFLSVREGNGINIVKYNQLDDTEININFFNQVELENYFNNSGFGILKSYTKEGQNHTWINIFAQKL